MSKKHNKAPAFRTEEKSRSSVEKRNSSLNETPIWRFDQIDMDGPFAFNVTQDGFKHKEVLEKLVEYGRLTWREIMMQTHDNGKSKHHYLSIEKLSKEAYERIQAKHLEEDVDDIFSFAFQNKLRIIGLRKGAEFHIVWYDTEHKFCPSSKK